MGRVNPYAPSKASLTAADQKYKTGGVWRDGSHVLVAHGASFPQRCVNCCIWPAHVKLRQLILRNRCSMANRLGNGLAF
jgi:hypothetical protein